MLSGVKDERSARSTSSSGVRVGRRQDHTDAGLGQLLNVKSTPTFYVNGRMPTQILPAQYFEVLIQLELQRTK